MVCILLQHDEHCNERSVVRCHQLSFLFQEKASLAKDLKACVRGIFPGVNDKGRSSMVCIQL